MYCAIRRAHSILDGPMRPPRLACRHNPTHYLLTLFLRMRLPLLERSLLRPRPRHHRHHEVPYRRFAAAGRHRLRAHHVKHKARPTLSLTITWNIPPASPARDCARLQATDAWPRRMLISHPRLRRRSDLGDSRHVAQWLHCARQAVCRRRCANRRCSSGDR